MPRLDDATLESNGFVLDTGAARLGRLRASSPDEPVTRLREAYARDGYLWLKGLLPAERVLGLRRRFFEASREAGLTAEGSEAVAGIYSGSEDKRLLKPLLRDFVLGAAYQSFCLSPELWRFLETLLGCPQYLHERRILRFTRPGDPNATGAHYDLTYLRAGTDRVHSLWIPLGDVAVEAGGLVYLEGSDAFGRRMEAEFTAMNTDLPPEERISAYNKNMAEGGWLTKDLPALAERADARWLVADYQAGDVVVHSAYTIHAALTNKHPDRRMRLSTDIRYQCLFDTIDERWSRPWSPDDSL